MATYDLIAGQGVSEFFTIDLRGEDGSILGYQVKYPNTEEMRLIVKLSNDLEDLINKKATTKAINNKAKESEAALESLISPVGHEFKFTDVFAVQPVNVQREFRQIIQKEFTS